MQHVFQRFSSYLICCKQFLLFLDYFAGAKAHCLTLLDQQCHILSMFPEIHLLMHGQAREASLSGKGKDMWKSDSGRVTGSIFSFIFINVLGLDCGLSVRTVSKYSATIVTHISSHTLWKLEPCIKGLIQHCERNISAWTFIFSTLQMLQRTNNSGCEIKATPGIYQFRYSTFDLLRYYITDYCLRLCNTSKWRDLRCTQPNAKQLVFGLRFISSICLASWTLRGQFY